MKPWTGDLALDMQHLLEHCNASKEGSAAINGLLATAQSRGAQLENRYWRQAIVESGTPQEVWKPVGKLVGRKRGDGVIFPA